jgi:DNA mismatch endonuclease (patch repair protein)
MSQIRSKDTKPELEVRRWLHKQGYRFRLHRKTLPGTPDIVLPRHKVVIFVHGCFWHRHKNCARATVPQTNQAYWNAKFLRNVIKDKEALFALNSLGWKVLVIWECEVKNGFFKDKIEAFLHRRDFFPEE